MSEASTFEKAAEALSNSPIVQRRQQEIREEKIHLGCLELLKSPDFFQKLCKQSQNFIEGELTSVACVNLVGLGGPLVVNANPASSNLCVNAHSGTGKDAVIKASLCKYLPKDSTLFHRTKISPAAFTYWKQPEMKKSEFSWNGKVVYLEDAGRGLLNSEVFKTMLSGGSNATIVKDQRAVELHIEGKPAIILTVAEHDPNNELLRRMPMVHLDESETQTKKIISFISRMRKGVVKPKFNFRIKQSVSYLKRVQVEIPFAEALGEAFQNYTGIAFRTHFERILDYVAFSAAIHQFQRKHLDGHVLASLEDWEIARPAIIATTQNSRGYSFTHKQQKILDLLKQPATVNELLERGAPYSRKGLYKALDEFRSRAVVSVESVEINNRTQSKYYLVKDKKFAGIPTLQEIQNHWDRLKSSTPGTLGTLGTPSTISTSSTLGTSSSLSTSSTLGTLNQNQEYTSTLTSTLSLSSTKKLSVLSVPKKSGSQNILNYIKKHDSGEGVSFYDVPKEWDMSEEQLRDELTALKNKGDLYEAKPDRFKVLR